MLLAFLAILPAALFPTATRAVRAATDLVEGVGGAANRVLASGANVTDSAARFVAAITDGSLSLGETAWRGYDLLNVSAACSSGRLFLDAEEDIEALLLSEAGGNVLQLPAEWTQELIAAVRVVAPGRPLIDSDFTRFHPNGDFQSLSIQVRWLKSGHVALAWRAANVTFEPRWANPAWALMGYDFGPQATEIGQTLQSIVQDTMAPPDLSLSITSIEDAPGMPSASWPWLFRWLGRQLRTSNRTAMSS